MQHIDDSHYWGAQAASAQVLAWASLRGKIPDATYNEVLKRLQFQAGHALVWRDAVTEWFTKMSGIADIQGRVGHHPNRVEVESMQLTGYTPVDVTPWETASGGRAVVCPSQQCSAQITWDRPDGWYDLSIQYFDLLHGHSHYTLAVGGNNVGEWIAANTLPSDKLNGHTSTRKVFTAVAIHRGDILRITGTPDGVEGAPLDYIEAAKSAALAPKP